MKRIDGNKRKLRWLAATAFACATVTVFALSSETLSVTSWGWFGAYSSSGSSSGYTGPSLVIGSTVNWSIYNSGVGGVGTDVNAYGSNAMYVGTWNKAVTGGTPVFVVGSGTSNEQVNALEVHQDGTVRIATAQGDVLMGDFTPQP